MRIYQSENVFEAAHRRIKRLFNEFENVIVSFSGGKDSTVVFNIAMNVARELNRLPLPVLFLDQEAEWDATIETVKAVMYNKDVKPYWLQIPFRIQNAVSHRELWLWCWRDGDEQNWIRPKDPISYKENKYGTDRFKELFTGFTNVEFANKRACYVAGVRCEESPTRTMGLTHNLTYKDITWAKRISTKFEHYTFYPIYDWKMTDVWKAIYDNNWPYCKIYDYMFNYGVNSKNMRVSNINHETAVRSLFYLQEIEPETYNRVAARLAGVDSAGKLNKDDYWVKSVPFMFSGWKEYRDYILENCVVDEKIKDIFRKKFDHMDSLYGEMNNLDSLYELQTNCILCNDFEFTKIENWERSPEVHGWRKYVREGVLHRNLMRNKYIKV